jgi:hypothetical protein
LDEDGSRYYGCWERSRICYSCSSPRELESTEPAVSIGVSEQDFSLAEQGSKGQFEYDSGDDNMRTQLGYDPGDDMETDENEIFRPIFNPRRRMWDPVEEQKANEGGGVRPEA